MAIARINDHQYFFDCDSLTVRKVSNGRWEVTMDEDAKFIVVGGRHSGGASNEWFACIDDQWFPVKSMIAAIRLGIGFCQ